MPQPSTISCIYVEHNDHLHIMFKRGNLTEKMKGLLRDCSVPVGDWYRSKLTKQSGSNPIKLPWYFKVRGQLVVIGNDLLGLWIRVRYLPPLETAEDCFSIRARAKTKSTIDKKITTASNAKTFSIMSCSVMVSETSTRYTQFLPSKKSTRSMLPLACAGVR